MKNSKSSLGEFKDFVDALTGKKEVDTLKTIFSNDDRIHYKNERDDVDYRGNKHEKSHDPSVDEFDSAEEFAEEYADDFDSFEEAMDYYEDEKDEN